VALNPADLLPDVEARLNKSGTTPDATELQTMLEAAISLYERMFGPVADTVTEVRNGGSPVIMLDRTPVASITSVTEYVGTVAYTLTSQPPGSTVNMYGYSLDDPIAGRLVRRSSAGMPMPFLGGYGSVVIAYITGTLPADHRETIVLDVAGYFAVTQRGADNPAGFPGDGEFQSAYTPTPQELFPRIRNLAKQYQALA
jgi:hypothetical protein